MRRRVSHRDRRAVITASSDGVVRAMDRRARVLFRGITAHASSLDDIFPVAAAHRVREWEEASSRRTKPSISVRLRRPIVAEGSSGGRVFRIQVLPREVGGSRVYAVFVERHEEALPWVHTDPQGVVTAAGRRAGVLFGCKLRGRALPSLLAEPHASRLAERLARGGVEDDAEPRHVLAISALGHVFPVALRLTARRGDGAGGGLRATMQPDLEVEACVEADAAGVVTAASPTFSMLFGHAPGALVGRPLAEALPGLDPDASVCLAARADGSHFHVAVEAARRARGGGLRVVLRQREERLDLERRNLPQEVGEYRLERALAQGGFSTVYAATHLGTGDGVAVKVLDKRALAADGLPDMPRDEARVMRELALAHDPDGGLFGPAHPSLVRLLDEFETDDKFCLVLEMCGAPLSFDVTLNDGLEEGRAMRVFRRVLGALSFMGAAGICHRDVKMGNVLLQAGTDDDAAVKLCDFGVSVRCGPEETRDDVVGSPLYLSPEEFSGAPYSPARADVWSLGVLLYVMLTNDTWADLSALAARGRVRKTCAPEGEAFSESEYSSDDDDDDDEDDDGGGLANPDPARMSPGPGRMSPAAADLVCAMLQTDPRARPTVDQLLQRMDAAGL